MGFFTWRAAKGTKKEVAKLRRDQAQQAAVAGLEAQAQAQQARETELFQQLPPEGKEEFRVARAAFSETWKAMGAWKRTSKVGKETARAFREDKEAVFRKYDLIP